MNHPFQPDLNEISILPVTETRASVRCTGLPALERDAYRSSAAGTMAALEEQEPECECYCTGDSFDPRGCELHDTESPWNQQMRAASMTQQDYSYNHMPTKEVA